MPFDPCVGCKLQAPMSEIGLEAQAYYWSCELLQHLIVGFDSSPSRPSSAFSPLPLFNAPQTTSG